MTDPKCSECALMLALEKWDYRKSGVPKTRQEGFVCLADAPEGIAIHMIGVDPNLGGCEMYSGKRRKLMDEKDKTIQELRRELGALMETNIDLRMELNLLYDKLRRYDIQVRKVYDELDRSSKRP